MNENKRVLAADIGGTKTHLAVFSASAGPRQPLLEATFPSGNYPSLEAIVHELLAGKGVTVDQASIAVAGPVVANRVQVTNLPWIVDGPTLSQELGGAHVRLLNDMEAIGHAIPYLERSELDTLNEGQAELHGALGVVAPGTGLGEGYLVWTGRRYRPFPSEGGHADFAPATAREIELLQYLEQRFSHVSCERVCAGIGIPNIYAFLRDSGRETEPAWLRDQLASAADQTPVIVQAGLANKAQICAATLEFFVSILGREAGNLALKVLATGGVYLGGGIPPRIVPALRARAFMESFTAKGRMGQLLARVPVHVIRRPGTGLFGAACHALAAGQLDE